MRNGSPAIWRKLESSKRAILCLIQTKRTAGSAPARQWIFEQFKATARASRLASTRTKFLKVVAFGRRSTADVVAILARRMEAGDQSLDHGGRPLRFVEPEIPAELRQSGARRLWKCLRRASVTTAVEPRVPWNARGAQPARIRCHACLCRVRREEQGWWKRTRWPGDSRAGTRKLRRSSTTILSAPSVSGDGQATNRRGPALLRRAKRPASRQIARFTRQVAARYYPEMVVDLNLSP